VGGRHRAHKEQVVTLGEDREHAKNKIYIGGFFRCARTRHAGLIIAICEQLKLCTSELALIEFSGHVEYKF
jgi:hypothetical protein